MVTSYTPRGPLTLQKRRYQTRGFQHQSTLIQGHLHTLEAFTQICTLIGYGQ